MHGWIKLYRKILDSEMYQKLNSKQRDVMITCLLLANHNESKWEYKGEIYSVKSGQFVTSLESLKKHCASDVTIQNIRTALKKLETWGFLTNESTKEGRLITIVNWEFYQSGEDITNKETNKELTKINEENKHQKSKIGQISTSKSTNELTNILDTTNPIKSTVCKNGDVLINKETNKETNKELTKNQQRASKNLTTNKNNSKNDSKNDKNIKNIYAEQVQQVFDFYLETFEGFFKTYSLTKERKAKIEARLKEGYTVEQIKTAIRNIRQSSFHCGENDRNKFYADITFVCRNASKLEEWINYNAKQKQDKNKVIDYYEAAKKTKYGW
ncbi:hypothetical protein [Tepidibacillus fermentans]|nr:hypothetical protein [Tepidibacillus fermentans]